MKKNLIKREIFLKKSTWLVLGMFAVALIQIPRFTTQAGKSLDSANFTPEVLEILEVAPANQFKLSNSGSNPARVENLSTAKNKKVNVTHITMTEFISSVDDISGKYDVVAITNETNGIPDKFNVGNKYRQYTPAFSQDMGYAHYLSDRSTSGATYAGKRLVEYYPENDITQKRAKQIVDMVNNKGQLVYIDSSITSKQDGTNLSTIFNGQGIGVGITSKDNFRQVTSNEINLEKIVDEYEGMSTSNKRVKVAAASGPNDEVRKSDGAVTNERNMEFTVKANAESDEKLKLRLYLDYDGDGVFRDDEFVKEQTVTGSNGYQTYTLNHQLYKGFIGYLDWKVEVVRESGVKTNVQSGVIMKSQANNGTGKKIIRVLQVYPNTDKADYFDNIYGTGGHKSNTRLLESKKFMALLKTPELDDYDIKIDDISLSDYEAQYGTSKGKHLEDYYDMVIIGFSDGFKAEGYVPLDFKNDDTLQDLKNFISNGNSVMFTHDTISLDPIEGSGMSNFTRQFKDYVGQSRYEDPFRNGQTSNLYKKEGKDGNPVTTNIPHDKVGVSGAISLGQTALSTNGNQDKEGQQIGTRLWEQTQTKKVKSVNDAQITTYPYDLREIEGNKKGEVNVSLTHTQWYQLNLEDEDVVPYYNLVSNGKYDVIDSGDSRNFYYTYVKNNITYSGTGHSGVGDELEELKLFVNTIIKCERGGNAKPEIENQTSDEVEIEHGSTVDGKIDSLEDYNFISIPTDPDDDDLKVSITADDVEVYSGKGLKAGNPIDVTIPNEVYAGKEKGYEFEVVTTVTDIMGATETKTFKLVCDGNRLPTIINQESTEKTIDEGQEIEISKFKDYEFLALPSDPDDEDKENLKVSILVDNKNIAEMSVGDEKIDADTNVNSDEQISVLIKKSEFKGKEPGDVIVVQSTVTDSKGKTDTKTFKLVIKPYGDPIVTLKNVTELQNGSFVEVPASKVYANGDKALMVGQITSLYTTEGTLRVEIPYNLMVEGDVVAYRSEGELKSEEWTMTKKETISKKELINNELIDYKYNVYEYQLDQSEVLSIGKIGEEGIRIFVKYNAKIAQEVPEEPGDYTYTYNNRLSFTDWDAKAAIKMNTNVPKKEEPVKAKPVDLF